MDIAILPCSHILLVAATTRNIMYLMIQLVNVLFYVKERITKKLRFSGLCSAQISTCCILFWFMVCTTLNTQVCICLFIRVALHCNHTIPLHVVVVLPSHSESPGEETELLPFLTHMMSPQLENILFEKRFNNQK